MGCSLGVGVTSGADVSSGVGVAVGRCAVGESMRVRMEMPVPGSPVFKYLPFLPSVTLAPRTPMDVLIPDRLIFKWTPDKIEIRRLKRRAIIVVG